MSNLLTSNISVGGIASLTIDVASQAANDTDESTVTVNGLLPGDFCVLTADAHSDGIGICDARCSTANTLSYTIVNSTAGAVDPAATATYKLLWLRTDSTRGDANA